MPRSVATPPVPVPALELSGEAQMGDHIIAAEWSPDGKRVATATVSGPVAIWDSGGQIVRELPGHKHGTFAVSWSAGGELLATGGQDGAARVWDAATGDLRQELDAGASWVEHVAFAPLGDFLVTAAGRQLKLWKAGGELVHAYGAHPSTISSVAWQPGALVWGNELLARYGTLAPSVEIIEQYLEQARQTLSALPESGGRGGLFGVTDFLARQTAALSE